MQQEAVSMSHWCLTRSVPGQCESQLVKLWVLREREITDWSGLHTLFRGFIGRFSLTKTRSCKFSAWIDCSGSWKSSEERTNAAQAKQSHHFSCCLICVLVSFLTFPIWQMLYGLQNLLFWFCSTLKMSLSLSERSHKFLKEQEELNILKEPDILGADTCIWTLKDLIALPDPA